MLQWCGSPAALEYTDWPAACCALALYHPYRAAPQEIKTKKRYGRLQKAMGDHCLLAGSPLDAQDHYSTGGWHWGARKWVAEVEGGACLLPAAC